MITPPRQAAPERPRPWTQAAGPAASTVAWAALAAAVGGLAALATGAAAHEESAAPALRDGVIGVGHAPEIVRDGDAFAAWIEFEQADAVANVSFQVCIVNELRCILGQRPASPDADGRTWRLDTADERAPGATRPPRWEAGMRVGVQYFLQDASGAWEPFPNGTPLHDPSCADPVACFETSYFAFDVAHGKAHDTPLGWTAAAASLAVAILLVRRTVRG